MFERVQSMGVLGLKAYELLVEVDYSKGLKTFELVGLKDTTVKESKERVRTLINLVEF